MSINTPHGAHRRSHSTDADAVLPEQAIASRALAPATADELYAQLIVRLGTEPTCGAVGFYPPSATGCFTARQNNYSGPVFGTDTFHDAAAKLAEKTVASGHAESEASSNVRNLKLVSRVIRVRDDVVHVAVAGIISPPDSETKTTFLDTACTVAELWHARQHQRETEGFLRETAVTMDLITLLESSDNVRGAGIGLVNAVQKHLGVSSIKLGLVRNGRGRCRLAARSGLSDVDGSAAVTRRIEDAFDECLARNRMAVFPATDRGNRDSLLAHERLAKDIQAARIVTAPLVTNAGEVVGAWMAIDNTPEIEEATVCRMLQLSAERVADTLHVVRRADRIFGRRPQTGRAVARLIKAAIVTALLSAVLLIPVPHKVQCRCSAEPDVRRYIVAPHEGLIEKTLVEAGDVVSAGQLLAKMDGRDVRWELAGLEAERASAIKLRDAAHIAGEIGESQRAALELQQVESRRSILEHRKTQLDLTSPLDGIVLDGHLERVENAPVTVGQPLFEVAPLSPVTVEVSVPDEDYAHVEAGFPVDVHFEGISGTFAGVIEAIRPRSEIRDSDNVFIATVIFANPDQQLRPGMKGYARISGKTRSLGWTLFHKPMERLCTWLPSL